MTVVNEAAAIVSLVDETTKLVTLPGGVGPPGPQGIQGPQGIPGVDGSSLAMSPMLPGRWWSVAPVSAAANVTQGVGTITWQPLWTGAAVRIQGVAFGVATIQDTAGNKMHFALYADNGNVFPGAFLVDIGNVDTTTVAANATVTLVCDVPVTPKTLYWIAAMSLGGTAPTMRTVNTGNPLIGVTNPTNGLGTAPTASHYITGQSAFPPDASIVASFSQAPPRLMVKAA